MVEARFVRLEGLGTPCLLLSPDAQLPDELVVDLAHQERLPVGVESKGRVTYRLQPSSIERGEPVYVEIFDD